MSQSMRRINTRQILRATRLEDRDVPATFTVTEAAGANAAAIQASVDSYRASLGTLNPNMAGSFGSGRREINWDGVPNALASPNALPADFFNTTSPRGAVFATPGSGFEVSANAGIAPVRFDNINASYSTAFSTFSAQRLFTAIGSNVTDVTFFIPGSPTPASVNGFGAVFTDVDQTFSTSIEFFTANNVLLFTRNVLPGTTANGSLSFLGAKADNGTPIFRVRITSGVAALGTDDITQGGTDKVVMDDFIYGEPIVAPMGGSVSGLVFNDINGDGTKQMSEPALPNFIVFEDNNANNMLDSNELNRATTATDGTYTLSFVADGARRIRVDRPNGFAVTTTFPTFVSIFGGTSDTLNFGVQDTTPPVVLSITRLDANPTNATQVSFLVTFSDNVTGVDSMDFQTNSTGTLAGVSIDSVSSGTNTYTVVCKTGMGSGTLDLRVVDDNSIIDSLGTPLGGPTQGDGNFTTGQKYDIDRIAPAVTINQAKTQADPTGSSPIVFDVVFNESVDSTTFTGSDISFAGSTVGGKLVAAVSGTGPAFTVSVTGMTGTGNVVASILAGKVNDIAGNGNAASTSTDNSVVFGTAPTFFIVPESVTIKKSVFFSTTIRTQGFPNATLTVTGLPPGMVFQDFGLGSGEIRGEPTQSGVFSVTISASNGIAPNLISLVTFKVIEPLYAVGAGAGGGPHVRVFNADRSERFSFYAYDPRFQGGVTVATADVNGDCVDDIITGAGPGGGPHVKVFDGRNLNELASFLAYDAAFRGGVFVAAGDPAANGHADIVTGAGVGGGPHVKRFSGQDFGLLESFFAYAGTFTGGVRVAVGDLNGDGLNEIITGAGPGGGPHVKAFSGGNVVKSFFAYAPAFTGGVYVAAGDINFDRNDDIITGAGEGGASHVQVFSGTNNALLQSLLAFDPSFTGGVRVASADVNRDGRDDIITGAGPGGSSHVIGYNASDLTIQTTFKAFDPAFLGGVFVG